ncbi:carbonic anhydrase [Arenicella xantha]|uniref:carbonic anhydrase n=2 Tax=Arenicella xantha TaxID=644221 RepID=A0A395JGQ4_9GAMM|nr:carbonic anhydrase [Arenicella xantha]RBP48699.1 carbonic anhydrase [Arenicella xantha]
MQADQALQKLIDGNQHFISATAANSEITTHLKPVNLGEKQKPFAVILGCSDSRVPAELVFHCGLGDLFVIRVAGNIVAPSQIGSIEFACQQFDVQLVVVLGHSHCGAINATVDALTVDQDTISPNIASIVDRVTPAVLPIVNAGNYGDRTDLIHQAMRANVEQSVNGLQMRSRQLRQLVRKGKLKIVGAEYSIESGRVDFYNQD